MGDEFTAAPKPLGGRVRSEPQEKTPFSSAPNAQVKQDAQRSWKRDALAEEPEDLNEGSGGAASSKNQKLKEKLKQNENVPVDPLGSL